MDVGARHTPGTSRGPSLSGGGGSGGFTSGGGGSGGRADHSYPDGLLPMSPSSSAHTRRILLPWHHGHSYPDGSLILYPYSSTLTTSSALAGLANRPLTVCS
jgi:hypothetical protein